MVSNGGECVPHGNQSPAVPPQAHSGLDLFSSMPNSSSESTVGITTLYILWTAAYCTCVTCFFFFTSPCPCQSVSSFMPQSRVTASVPENLSLFLDSAPKAGEGTVKKLSKDSILSLYASTPSVHASSLATHGEDCCRFLGSLSGGRIFLLVQFHYSIIISVQ